MHLLHTDGKVLGDILDVLLAKFFNLKMLGKINDVVSFNVVSDDDNSLLILEHLVHLYDLADASASIQSSNLSLNINQTVVLGLHLLLKDLQGEVF